MTNIDSNELSDVELAAVSGGDFTILPSKEAVEKVTDAVTLKVYQIGQSIANVFPSAPEHDHGGSSQEGGKRF